MNIKSISTLIIGLFINSLSFSQVLVEDFESGEVTSAEQLTWHTPADLFGGVEENPKPDEVNPSEAVFMARRLTSEQDNFWSGFYIDFKTEFVAASQGYNKIQLKYFRTSELSTIVIKINGAGEEFGPVNAPVKVNEWEVLEFDYRAQGFSQIANLDIRPDWRPDDENPVETGTLVYIDDITFVEEYEAEPFDGFVDDFEEKDILDWYAVNNPTTETEIVDNPTPNDINFSNKVLKVVKKSGAQFWEGVIKTGLSLPLGYGEGEYSYLHMKVLKPLSSEITIVFKKDGSEEEFYAGGTNTKSNEWEYLIIEVGYLEDTFQQMFIQPDKTENQTQEVTLYIDDIFFSNSNESGTTGVDQPEVVKVPVYLQGSQVIVNEEGSVEIYSISGALIKSVYVQAKEAISLNAGFYLVKTGNQTTKVVIR